MTASSIPLALGTALVLVACVLCPADAAASPGRQAAVSRPEVVLMATPARARRRCQRIALLAHACPGRVARVPDWSLHARRFRTTGYAVWDFSHGAADTPRPEQARPPRAFHLLLMAGRLDTALGGFELPITGSPTPILDGLMRQDRADALFFGRIRWGRRTGSLVLAPPYPAAGAQSNHLIFSWRHEGRTYALGIHGWEPFTETVRTLRRIVASLPDPRRDPHRVTTRDVRRAGSLPHTPCAASTVCNKRHGGADEAGSEAMGRRYGFTCAGCGHRAEASGEPDSGKLVAVQTMTCLTCRSLVDVVTEIHARGPWLDTLDNELDRCPTCHGQRLEPWGDDARDHDDQPATGPCPRCEARMRRGDLTILWD